MACKRSMKSVYAVILVGGIGKRLRPLSSPTKPKPFLSVTRDRKTIFRKTVDRIGALVPSDNIAVVANRTQAHLVRKSFPRICGDNLLLERASRNTAPAIALAALELKKRDNDAVMIVLPADHYIGNLKEYIGTLEKGVDFVKKNPNALVTVGLKPKFPATGYGYIRVRGKLGAAKNRVCKVERFVEKPDIETARKFLQDDKYLWNTGTFIFRASAFLDAIRNLATDIYGALKDMRKIDEKYELLPNISVDYAIMEKADNIYCVRGSYLWEDIGSFESLKKVLKLEGKKFTEKGGKVVKIA